MGENSSGDARIKLGIARCLLGENVRYDGGHKLDTYLRDVLGQYVEWVPVCPEVECGMTVPREALRLAGDVSAPRLVGRRSGEDWTERMTEWGWTRLDALEKEGLCGYIFKHGSPSNAMGRMKVFQENGRVLYTGRGIWAAMVMERFPWMPCEDDGRLHDARIRENFITRIFTLKRWKDAVAGDVTVEVDKGVKRGAVVDFHTRHKMLVLAHNEKIYREMGRLVASTGTMAPEVMEAQYLELLLKALNFMPTAKKHVNVLDHAMGYFKKDISSDEKAELKEVIEQYRCGLVPLIVPIALLNHHVRKHGKDYLKKQYYLNPFPVELMLRNHV
ncbi:DUF523 and DUF1722 domain-containing protein [Maridesulfovibrio sp.]|uniref:YbgA family protein n=1 Tax=Maridesulfovibrio sp. TaxID=2795000 RepID=UPI002A1874F5|nr:DUF523 and DUF1722 domain-containing protein [Maridesulfovibrio sp.]